MEKIELKVEQQINSIENFVFEPIQGYPLLHWKGKRPFRSTCYYPAQLKESFGDDVNGWLNKLFWGDNLQVMSYLLKRHRGIVDLIYIDPPFDSKIDYKKTIELRGSSAKTDRSAFEEKQYSDIWSADEYLQFMYERLILLRELLSDTGSIYVHCDWHKSHLIRSLMDEIFGQKNFRNEIAWKRGTVKGAKAVGNQYARNYDCILFYSKSETYTYNRQYTPYSEEYIKQRFTKDDHDGRGPYTDQALGSLSTDTINKLREENRLFITSSGKERVKQYLSESPGIAMDDFWADISEVNSMATDNTQYPTQKPVELLERIIKSSSKPGDLVFDCFAGSGTTLVAAMKLGRRFIGADINLGAIETSVKRIISDSDIQNKQVGKSLFEAEGYLSNVPGLELYNVNNYDVFRNPIEAKDILLNALEIQRLPGNNLYDGEKDGRMIKIMPINRIATRADLNELITNFPYSIFDKRNEDNPGKPVEYLTLVCMGHEPDLAGQLKLEVKKSGYVIDVEVIDILRDKSNIEFKRDADADIKIEGNKLIIRDFYPMNLLQKLSLQQESIDNWRTLVDSIKIDFNYDGSVLSPTLIDIPENKSDLVKGIYPIPNDATTIRIKITDLLSESFETTIKL